jgi:hypothetical protein
VSLPLRRFTSAGLAKFQEFLASPVPSSTMPFAGELLDDELSEDIPRVSAVVDLSGLPTPCTKFQLATYIVSRVPSVADQALLIDDEKAAAFMVAARFELFASRHSSGHWNLKGRERYVPNLNSPSLFYRHPVSCVALYSACGSSSEVCLYTDARVHGDVMEQVASRPDVACNTEMMKVLNLLYWNVQTRALKAGVLGTGRPHPNGCLRRFIGPGSFVERYGTTHDFFSMKCEEIVALLPPEFDDFKP